ncbi:response regulator [bacterium]|nr:response regulator [bacterium]
MFTVLTVDDESMICEMIGSFLESKGYAVKTALSGEAAMNVIDQGVPDLILLDMIMPGMGGDAILKEIKSHYKDLPVIMVTAVTDEKKALKLLEEGASDYITKPIDFEYLEKNLSVWKSLKS